MPNHPIACTLSADDMHDRLSAIGELWEDALLDRTPTEHGVRIALRDTPDIERRARELIAAEARCCPFLTFNLQREASALVLDITGPPEARPVIDLFG